MPEKLKEREPAAHADRFVAAERRFVPSPATLQRTVALWGAALLAGCLGAVSIYGFRLLITGVEWLFTRRTGSFPDAAEHLQPWVRIVVPIIGGVLAGAVLQLERRSPGAKPHIDYIDAARARSATLNDRSTAARTVSSLSLIHI